MAMPAKESDRSGSEKLPVNKAASVWPGGLPSSFTVVSVALLIEGVSLIGVISIVIVLGV